MMTHLQGGHTEPSQSCMAYEPLTDPRRPCPDHGCGVRDRDMASPRRTISTWTGRWRGGGGGGVTCHTLLHGMGTHSHTVLDHVCRTLQVSEVGGCHRAKLSYLISSPQPLQNRVAV